MIYFFHVYKHLKMKMIKNSIERYNKIHERIIIPIMLMNLNNTPNL